MKNKILGHRYRILSLIGEGGMASVYKALDMKLERRVAVKVLHAHLFQNDDIRSRFQLEAKALSGIDHPNIIKIYDFSGADSNQLWIVMEILKGETLTDFCKNFPKNSLHPILAAIIMQEVCRALASAHNQGIIHRDIKPDNIMVLNDGRIKLMDFGIAKDIRNSSMTMTGTFMGSPSYMSPEQIRGKDIDNRSDIYSLSVMFYEVVTGVLPFTGGTTPDVINKIMIGKYLEPRTLVRALPSEINALIVKGMQGDAALRFQQIEEFSEELSKFLAKHDFMESHIELERFFRDRAAFEKRLSKLRLGNSKLPRQTMDKSSHRATHATEMFDESQMRATEIMPSTVKIDAPRNVGATHYVDERTARMQRSRTVHSGTMMNRPGDQTVIDRPNAYSAKHPLPKKASQRARRGTHYGTQEASFTQRLMGIGIYAAILLTGVISFVQFTKLFEPEVVETDATEAPSTPTTNTPASKDTGDKPASNVTPTPAEPKPQPEAKEKEKEAPAPKTEPVRPERKPAPAPTPVVAPKPRPEVKTPVRSPKPSAPEPRVPTRTPITPVRKPTAPAPQAVEPKAEPTPTPQATTGLVMIQSQPAAEILIDGKPYGTTNDFDVRRRGIRLSAGPHKIELRRRGFGTLTRNFRVEGGAQRTLNFRLEKDVSFTKFTIYANKTPAKAIIEERGGNLFRKELDILKESVSINLTPGTYRIRVEYGTQVIERTITLTPNREGLGFTADFREE